MRIIGGEARGRRLATPVGHDTRPTYDRVRESVFGILGPRLRGAAVLDLFAGSGALALEALSRGAERAVFVDHSRKAADAIRTNIEAVRVADRARLLVCDWREALQKLRGERFTLVFLDPPYRMEDVYEQAAREILEYGLLAPDGRMVFEHARGVKITLPSPLVVCDVRRYGDTSVSFAYAEEPL